MRKRNYSMQRYWEQMAANHTPRLRYTPDQDYAAWQSAALTKLHERLGDWPERVPLDAEVEYSVERDGLIEERVVFEADAYMSVPCIVLYRQGMSKDKCNPAILCSHGHGAFGKYPVAGVRLNQGIEDNIALHNYNYAEQLAQRGYLTITPDLRSFGERRDGFALNEFGRDPFPGRDVCNINFIKGALFGMYTMTLNIWDFMRCIDYLETRDEVDPGKIGMIGLSQGGTMTTFTTAIEPRIRAACICGYVNPFADFAIRDANFCGSQIVPELYKYFDTHDVAGMIAPRPLLLDMGTYDDCFPIHDLMDGYERTKAIYDAAGCGDKLHKDVHLGGHAFGGSGAFAFFDQYLR